MTANEYQFVTRWRVRGTPEEVYDILNDVPDLVRWWPAVYLDVTDVSDNEEESVYEMYTTGLLPYTLRWQLHPVERTPPERIEIEARGDLVGRGVWTISPTPLSGPDGPWVDVTYEWTVCAEKPLLRWFSFLLKPVFILNHHWAMAKGEESLRLELARRREPTEDARAHLSPPPQPTTISPVALIAVLVLLLSAVYWTARGRSD